MHKLTKLTPSLRREIYRKWCLSRCSYRSLAKEYHVDKNIIITAILRGRLKDFSVHDSCNHRYRTIEYGLKRLAITDKATAKRLEGQAHRKKRYEKTYPGEMVHGDTKGLPAIRVTKYGKIIAPPETLYVMIDDYSRYLVADILPRKNMWDSALFFEIQSVRTPFPIHCHYSDNGGEYKGNLGHAFVALCMRFGIEQKFTKPRHPWTNGKAERVIKTILNEWWYPLKHTFRTAEERRNSLYTFVEQYNHQRGHQSLAGLTPAKRLARYYEESGENA
jgi:transposase InsO family protein